MVFRVVDYNRLITWEKNFKEVQLLDWLFFLRLPISYKLASPAPASAVPVHATLDVHVSTTLVSSLTTPWSALPPLNYGNIPAFQD